MYSSFGERANRTKPDHKTTIDAYKSVLEAVSKARIASLYGIDGFPYNPELITASENLRISDASMDFMRHLLLVVKDAVEMVSTIYQQRNPSATPNAIIAFEKKALVVVLAFFVSDGEELINEKTIPVGMPINSGYDSYDLDMNGKVACKPYFRGAFFDAFLMSRHYATFMKSV
jgi:hypothetical protein